MINFLLKPSLRLVAAITSSVSVLGVLSLSSCQDYEPFTVEEVSLAKQSRTFATNFVNHYGEPDPDHTWGFRDMSEGSVALTRVNVEQKNNWLANPGQAGYIADKVAIPGWPDKWEDRNGKEYIGWPGTDADDTSDDYHNEGGYASTNGSVPGGDVTDEEIEYVSWWFRTNQYPGSVQVHFSDFFIQEISSDVDRNPDGTKNDNVPTYRYRNGETKPFQTDNQTLSFQIDQLEVKTFNSTTSSDAVNKGYDHIYNFNSGKSNMLSGYADLPMKGEDPVTCDKNSTTKYPVRNIGFYTSSGTEDFAAHYSNDSKWRFNNDAGRTKPIWVLVYLDFYGPKTGRHYVGWYLGFDYEFKSSLTFDGGHAEQERKADGYYSNWILKISPGRAIPSLKTTRVMCEDLGNTFDYDFNDVVFDATYNGGSDWTISIEAAGGTLPIYVGYEPGTFILGKEMEAHTLMEAPKDTPVNVDGTKRYAPAIYHIQLDSSNAADIPIYVVSSNNVSGEVTTSVYQIEGPGKKGKNAAPQKFAVPTSVRWMKECKFIEWGYDQFPAWVADHNLTNWYEHVKDEEVIYK